MYGVVYIMTFPGGEDPKVLSLNLFDSFSKALKHTESIIEEFIEDYGEDIIESATMEDPVAIMYNGEVTAYAFVVETS